MRSGSPTGNPATVIVFDGECVLCSANARFVLDHDHRRRFLLATAQGDAGRTIQRQHGLDSDAMATMVVVRGDQVFTQSDAVLAIAGELGWPWRAALVARLVPRGVRDRIYRLVARNRYRWFGRRETCWLPRPEEVDRIL